MREAVRIQEMAVSLKAMLDPQGSDDTDGSHMRTSDRSSSSWLDIPLDAPSEVKATLAGFASELESCQAILHQQESQVDFVILRQRSGLLSCSPLRSYS
jgi:hypothetical protein